MAKRVLKPKPKPTRGQDRERVQKQRLDQIPAGAWRDTRLEYPPEVRSFVDRLASRGAALVDLYMMQAAVFRDAVLLFRDEKRRREEALARQERDHSQIPGAKTLTAYQHSMTQSLKHMRQIAELMGPQLTANDMPVRIPEGMDSESISAILDGLEPSEILD